MESAFSALYAWYNPHYGLFNTTGWWNNANAITAIGNVAKYDPNNVLLQDIVARIFVTAANMAPKKNPQPGVETGDGHRTGYNKKISANGRHSTMYPDGWFAFDSGGVSPIKALKDIPLADLHTAHRTTAPNAHDWLDGYYDDDLWWALAWLNTYDVIGDPWYLSLAESIFNAVSKVWPTHCGNGGIYWAYDSSYVNAISNELFLSTAASLANRATHKKERKRYLEWARLSLDWFLRSGMISESGLINDGLTDGCVNNNKTAWSYNQGVILGGLVELHRASPNSTYLSLASKIAHSAIDHLSDSTGVIHDECEPDCGADGTQFKGIFVRNLQALHAVVPDDAYVETIQICADNIWWDDRDEWNRLSVIWGGDTARFVVPANASTHSSAMEALIAAVTVR